MQVQSSPEKLNALVLQLIEALQANGVFHTPIARHRRGGQWDEYETDAINRTREALNAAAQFIFDI